MQNQDTDTFFYVKWQKIIKINWDLSVKKKKWVKFVLIVSVIFFQSEKNSSKGFARHLKIRTQWTGGGGATVTKAKSAVAQVNAEDHETWMDETCTG